MFARWLGIRLGEPPLMTEPMFCYYMPKAQRSSPFHFKSLHANTSISKPRANIQTPFLQRVTTCEPPVGDVQSRLSPLIPLLEKWESTEVTLIQIVGHLVQKA